MEEERIFRYKSQSCRCRASALREMREGRWDRMEEHLWGSLVGAVKAVAISRGRVLGSDEDIKVYVAGLAQETRNRRIGDAFNQLSSFPAFPMPITQFRTHGIPATDCTNWPST